ncbi:hypothetical protein VTK73DRAFT_1663 [Phialemonium thermophilum]|uniref:Uncharacterized protein n=1 Tax=Phialemonium thermophilum TaxID=223376 RepID=A0ABR3X8J6_9PEZI
MVCDYDIVIPRPPHSGIGLAPGVADPWREMSSIWIQQAEVQGAAYEQLYSMAALGKPAHERAEHARVLAERLKDIVRQAVALRMRIVAAFPSAARAVNEDILRHDIAGPAAVSFIVLKSDEVSLWSSLALVTRAIPPPPGHPSRFNSECIEAARAAFRSHQECMRLTGSIRVMKSIYLHW